MNYSSRFFLYAPLVLVLLIGAGISLLWWRTAGAMEQQLAALKGHEAVPGVVLDWSRVAIGGFPFRVDAVFEDFSAQGEGPRGPFRWQSEKFALHTLTYGARQDVFEAAGLQRLNWVDAAQRPRSFSFRPGALHASAVRDGQGLARFDVDVIQLAGDGGVSMGRAQFHMRRGEGGKSIDMMVSADAASGELGPYFGKGFKSLRFYQTLQSRTGYTALLKGEISPRAAHTEWHDGGSVASVTATEMNGVKSGMTIEQFGTIGGLLEALY